MSPTRQVNRAALESLQLLVASKTLNADLQSRLDKTWKQLFHAIDTNNRKELRSATDKLCHVLLATRKSNK